MQVEQLLTILITALGSLLTILLTRSRLSVKSQEFVQSFAETSRNQIVELTEKLDAIESKRDNERKELDGVKSTALEQADHIERLQKQLDISDRERERDKANIKQLTEDLIKANLEIEKVKKERSAAVQERDELKGRVEVLEKSAKNRETELETQIAQVKSQIMAERVVFKEVAQPMINDLIEGLVKAVQERIKSEA